MPINDAALAATASTLQSVMLYAQLHTDAAGVDGTDNLCGVGRKPISWTAPGVEFGLASPIRYISGTAGEVVAVVTVWDAETGGSVWGEFVLDGDGVFNPEGEYLLTALDFTATAIDLTDGS